MDKMLELAIVIGVIILLLVIVIYEFLKIRKTIKIANRIDKFTLKVPGKNEPTIGDDLNRNVNSLISKISNILSKSTYFTKKANKYDRYSAIKKNPNYKYDVYSIKILISILVFMVYTVTSVLNKNFEFPIGLIFLVLGYFATDIYLEILNQIRIKNIEGDLLKAIIVMNNAFKSGLNISNALDVVITDLDGPVRDEFMLIKKDLSSGIDTSEAFNRFYKRVKLDDAQYISSSLSILNVTGGNITFIFSNIEEALTNKKKLKDELKAMTASSMLVYRVLTFMPFILIFIILILLIFQWNNLSETIQKQIYPKKYEQYVDKYSQECDVDNLLIYSIIKVESNFNEKANSHAEAIGLMQLMENTAVETYEHIEAQTVNVEELYQPEINIKIGTYYFSTLLNQYNNMGLALAAYNAGMGRVDKWIKEGTIKQDGSDLENIPFKETNLYIRKVLNVYEKYKELYEKY